MSGYKYKNHVQIFQQISCHQNTPTRGPQTVKTVFDITCGIGDFIAYIFCPLTTQELPNKQYAAESSEWLPIEALSQIDYRHTGHC